MHQSETWRELLGEIITDTKERKRISEALKVNYITLVRWTTGVSHPRVQNLQALLETLPQHRESLRKLIAQEYEGFLGGNDSKAIQKVEGVPSLNIQAPGDIHSSFYHQVLELYTTSPSSLRFFALLNLIVQKMLLHFDRTGTVGIQVLVAQCIYPNGQDQHVHSLRTIIHQATPSWPSPEHEAMLMGMESLVGYAVVSGHTVVEQDLLRGQSFLSASDNVIERSAAACPIILGNGLAGCVMVSSTKPRYFTAPLPSLIQHYAQLLTLAFDPSDFYPLDKFELRVMPTYQQQQPHVQLLSTRIRQILRESLQHGYKKMTSVQAEALAWQELEQKLLEMSPDYPSQDESLVESKIAPAEDTNISQV